MASALNHPHILTVYDVGELEGRQFLVTELVDGGPLDEWAIDKRTWRDYVELMTQVADGLATAHAAGILHRDIKPGNILVAKSVSMHAATFSRSPSCCMSSSLGGGRSDRDGASDLFVKQIGAGPFVNLTNDAYVLPLSFGTRSIGFTADGSSPWIWDNRLGGASPIAQNVVLYLSPSRSVFYLSSNGAGDRLTAGPAFNPIWSPKGDLLVYAGPSPAGLTPLLAVRPDGAPVDWPEVRMRTGGSRSRFVPDGTALVYMEENMGPFLLLDVATGQTRELARLSRRARTQSSISRRTASRSSSIAYKTTPTSC